MRSLPGDGNLSEAPRAQRRPAAKPLAEDVDASDRKRGMVAAYQTGDYTMQQIADAFGVHHATVSRAARAAEQEGQFVAVHSREKITMFLRSGSATWTGGFTPWGCRFPRPHRPSPRSTSSPPG